MKENFRQFLDRLRQAGELVDLKQAVDIRHIATLVDQAQTALYFHNVIGYDVPVVSGIIRSKERAVMSMGCQNFGEIEKKLAAAIAKPIPPKYVNGSPTRDVVLTGDDVDLFAELTHLMSQMSEVETTEKTPPGDRARSIRAHGRRSSGRACRCAFMSARIFPAATSAACWGIRCSNSRRSACRSVS